MSLESFISMAAGQGASDLHLEPGMPATLRVRGELKTVGDPLPGETLRAIAKSVLSPEQWNRFVSRHSADLAKTISGVRCRINILQSSRGVGLAVRLLSRSQPTIERLNLHPDLARFVRHPHGLILVTGPTGCGKSSTLAALIHEVNVNQARHIVTLEQPIEFVFRPRKALIRQREVGLDTPSFRRGLLDAMREDPDVLMVGELRDPETMRLTINAAETGHLVLSTVHSASVAEALARISSAFPPEIQPMVCAQLADCLRAVICQRLSYREDLGIRIPECEILVGTTPVRSLIRQGQFFKLVQALETGGRDGQYTRERYGAWLQRRQRFHIDARLAADEPDEEPSRPIATSESQKPLRQPSTATPTSGVKDDEEDIIVINPPTGSLRDILEELDES